MIDDRAYFFWSVSATEFGCGEPLLSAHFVWMRFTFAMNRERHGGETWGWSFCCVIIWESFGNGVVIGFGELGNCGDFDDGDLLDGCLMKRSNCRISSKCLSKQEE